MHNFGWFLFRLGVSYSVGCFVSGMSCSLIAYMFLAINSRTDMSSAIGEKNQNQSPEMTQLKVQNIFLMLLFTIKILKRHTEMSYN